MVAIADSTVLKQALAYLLSAEIGTQFASKANDLSQSLSNYRVSKIHFSDKPMVSTLQVSRRYRGFVLTHQGMEKLQERIQQLEMRTRIRQSPGMIAQRVQLTQPDGIHPMTVRKLLRRQKGVDKRSILCVFEALQIQLEEGDYAHARFCFDLEMAEASGF